MSKHHPDLILCRKQCGVSIGKVCEKCDGKCVICDSHVRPKSIVHICDECNYGASQGKCIVCGNKGYADAYYCRECTILEKDRDGCPKVINVGTAKTDLFFDRKRYGTSQK
uniref:PHD finger-like domain-containing protein 5A n=1 Tax=Timspurckia oligopyrenoides TaxID=708627 RepID=A0A7S0ZGS6_9RHOD|mmetsp:Transcript_456/g.824  ORF Transcript_456/g.824 Transcript_456/m.824 type:complete len:111 (+) Transcript_456:142-474(+)